MTADCQGLTAVGLDYNVSLRSDPDSIMITTTICMVFTVILRAHSVDSMVFTVVLHVLLLKSGKSLRNAGFLALNPDKPHKIYGWPALDLGFSLHFCVVTYKNTAEPVILTVNPGLLSGYFR